jgi:chromosome segregation ATPase
MDIERTMQFIVEQQGQFWASVQKHDEQIAKNNEQIAKNDQQIAKNDQQIAKNDQQIAALTSSVQKHDAAIATLTDLVGRLAQAEIRMAEQTQTRLASLETKTTQFFERMDRFIKGLEGNGHKPQ